MIVKNLVSDFIYIRKYEIVLFLGFQIESKQNLLLPKSDSFPNLKTLYVMYIQGKVPSFLTTLGKNENFSKLQDFTIGMYVDSLDLQKLKIS